MDKNELPQKFTVGQSITLNASLTPEQYRMLAEWSARIPKMYLLDICVVNATKLLETSLTQGGRKYKLVERLHELDRPNNCFSYLCALMEKVSDSHGKATDTELEEQILSDLSSMRAFFKKAQVYEPDDFVIAFLKELRKEPIELKRPDYLEFLNSLNNKFSHKDPVSPKHRLKKAKDIIEKADNLSISRQHPIVAIALACIYGNIAAKKLMKFKAAPQKFDAENALADIMLIYRISIVKLQIEHMGLNGVRFLRTKFITDDDGLSEVIKCFKAKTVEYEAIDDGCKTQLTMTVELRQMLTEIQSEEYGIILDLLLQIPEEQVLR